MHCRGQDVALHISSRECHVLPILEYLESTHVCEEADEDVVEILLCTEHDMVPVTPRPKQYDFAKAELR